MRAIVNVFAAMLVVLCTGCASVGDYFRDRALDAADVFTVTSGLGIGGGGRLGPLHAGLAYFDDAWGVRAGDCTRFIGCSHGGDHGVHYQATYEATFVSIDTIVFTWGEGDYSISQVLGASKGRYTYKQHDQVVGWPFLIFVDDAETVFVDEAENKKTFGRHDERLERKPFLRPFYTQIDLYAAAALGARVGFNPGEFLDFGLGWFAIDIYKDDDSDYPESVLQEKLEPMLWDKAYADSRKAGEKAYEEAMQEAKNAGMEDSPEIIQKAEKVREKASDEIYKAEQAKIKETARREAERIVMERAKAKQRSKGKRTVKDTEVLEQAKPKLP